MPEAQPRPGVGDHPGGSRLLHDLYQAARGPPRDYLKILDRELLPEHRGPPEHRQRVLAKRCQPSADHPGERHRYADRGTPVELGDSSADLHPFAAYQRIGQLPGVERVAAGAFGELGEPLPRLAADHPADQIGDFRRRERLKRDHMSAPGRHAASKLGQIISDGRRPQRSDDKQRRLTRRPAEPVPDKHARLVRPLQVLGDDDERTRRAEPVSERQQPLGPGQHRITGDPRACGAAEVTGFAQGRPPAFLAQAVGHQPEREMLS